MRIPIILALAALTAMPAYARVQADHAGHSPAPSAAQPKQAPAAASGRMGGGGMMGGRMVDMQGCAIRNPAALKAALEITPAQTALWNAFADAAQAMPAMGGMMRTGTARALSLPARLEQQEKMLADRLAAVRKTRGALAPLYAALTPAQKAKADAQVCGGGMNTARAG